MTRRPGKGFSLTDRTTLPDRIYPEPDAEKSSHSLPLRREAADGVPIWIPPTPEVPADVHARYLMPTGLTIACTAPVMRAGPSVNRNSQAWSSTSSVVFMFSRI